jgi:hypothetical protein
MPIYLLQFRWSKVEITTDGQSVSMSWYQEPCGTCDQILLPVGMLLSEICGLVSVGRPLWREDRSEICSVITQWSGPSCAKPVTIIYCLIVDSPNLEGHSVDTVVIILIKIFIPNKIFMPSNDSSPLGVLSRKALNTLAYSNTEVQR